MTLPTIRSEIGFGSNPDDTSPSWIDVSDYLLEFTCRRGRNYELDTIDAGTATPTYDNRQRRFDPLCSRGPFYPNVVPMVRVRHIATWDDVDYPLHSGFVDAWPINYLTPTWSTTSPTVVDAFASLNAAAISGDFAEQATGARIADLLEAAMWPSFTLPAADGFFTLDSSLLDGTDVLGYVIPTSDIEAGLTLVQALSLTADQAVTALSAIQDTAQAEPGVFFIDGSGKAIFQDRRHRYLAPVAAAFSDTATGAEISYEALGPDYGVAHVVNEVVVSRTEASVTTSATANDDASRARYLRRTMSLSLPLTDDADLVQRAGFELLRFADPFVRFERIRVRPQGQPAAWPTVLALDIGSKVTVEWTPAADVLETETQTCFVEAIEHTVTPDDWVVEFQLSPGDYYANGFILDTSVLDGVDALVY